MCEGTVLRSGEPAYPLRLIRNLVPTNSYQRATGTDVDQLLLFVQWSSISLLAHELILWTSVDRKCFFYVFRLPSFWKRFMTFVQLVDGSMVGKKPGNEVYVASTAVAMG